MVQLGQQTGLPQERFYVGGFPDMFRTRHLDGDVPLQLLIVGKIDFAKPAVPQDPADAITSNVVGDGLRFRRDAVGLAGRVRQVTGRPGRCSVFQLVSILMEDPLNQLGMFWKLLLVIGLYRFFALGAAARQFDGQQLANQLWPPVLVHILQVVGDLRVFTVSQCRLERVADAIELHTERKGYVAVRRWRRRTRSLLASWPDVI